MLNTNNVFIINSKLLKKYLDINSTLLEKLIKPGSGSGSVFSHYSGTPLADLRTTLLDLAINII